MATKPPAGASRTLDGGTAEKADGALRSTLLKAAVDAMVEHGYHGTSIRAIADRANVSSAAMYHHFGSKQDLLAVFMRTIHDEHFQRLQHAVLQSAPDPASRLSALARTQVLTQTTLQKESFVGKTELRALEPGNRAMVVDKRMAIQRLFDEVIEDGAASGVFATTNPREASRAVVMMCTAVSDWYQPNGPLSAEEIADTYVELSLATVALVGRAAGASNSQKPAQGASA